MKEFEKKINEPNYSKYITPQEYERAESNGVDNLTLYRRITIRGWNHERAITTPISRKKKHWNKKYFTMAISNGIGIPTYKDRILRGWHPVKAATLPPLERGMHCIKC